MNFEFATTTRIIFGNGKSSKLGILAKSFGNHALLVSGLSNKNNDIFIDNLSNAGITSQSFNITSEPTITRVRDGVAKIRELNCDLVIGLGGGSALDAGKAIAALATNPGEPIDYLEVIGDGKSLMHAPLPFIAIPTTAGTGAEVTRNAVISSPEHRVKVSLRSPLMLPKLAIIDPKLTLSLPPALTASTGLDALTQCIEPFVTHLSNPLTDGFCRQGIHYAAVSLRDAFMQGNNISGRSGMALAALFGGLALANAKLGAVHGFAGPLGGMYPMAPHGMICGRLLPIVMEANVAALRTREPQNPAISRYDEVARILTSDPTAQATDGVAWVKDLASEFNVVPLSNFGVNEDDFPTIVEKARKSSSMKGNPIKLTYEELHNILRRANT